MKDIKTFICKCCQLSFQNLNIQINNSGYCVKCYGNCLFSNDHKCTQTKIIIINEISKTIED